MRILGVLGIWLCQKVAAKGIAVGILILRAGWVSKKGNAALPDEAALKKYVYGSSAAAVGLSGLLGWGLFRLFRYEHAGLLALIMTAAEGVCFCARRDRLDFRQWAERFRKIGQETTE